MAKIICVVDNAAPEGSTLRTEHGVSFWIALDEGNVLFDTGASAEVLTVNLKLLGLQVEDIDALAFSHAHFDHTGGIEVVLKHNKGIPIYANADIYRARYMRRDGKFDPIGFEKSSEDYESRAEWHLQDEPTEILPGLWTTGLIKNRDYPEGRSARHQIREKGKFVPDPYLDDMSLVLKTSDGLVLICGCCHAGILNTLAHVKTHFEGPIIAVLGGIHLMPAEKPMIDKVVNALKEDTSGARFWLNHCTGDDALLAMNKAFEEKAHHFKAGEVITF